MRRFSIAVRAISYEDYYGVINPQIPLHIALPDTLFRSDGKVGRMKPTVKFISLVDVTLKHRQTVAGGGSQGGSPMVPETS